MFRANPFPRVFCWKKCEGVWWSRDQPMPEPLSPRSSPKKIKEKSLGTRKGRYKFSNPPADVWSIKAQKNDCHQEPVTPIISQWIDIFTDQSIFRCFSREIGQFQSTWARFGEDKTMRPHVNMSTSCRHVNISPCLWLQLVTEIPVRIWIREKFKLKIYRSVKRLQQEYGVAAGSWWWAPAVIKNSSTTILTNANNNSTVTWRCYNGYKLLEPTNHYWFYKSLTGLTPWRKNWAIVSTSETHLTNWRQFLMCLSSCW